MKIILKPIYLFLDLFFISLSFFLAFTITFYEQIILDNANHSQILLSISNLNLTLINFKQLENYDTILLLVICFWLILSLSLNLLHVPRTTKRILNSFWRYSLYPQFIMILMLSLSIIFLNYDTISRLFLFYFIIINLLLLTISKFLRNRISQYLRISGFDSVKLAILSNDNDFTKLKKWCEDSKNNGFNLVNLTYSEIETYNKIIKFLRKLKNGDYLIIDKDFLKKYDILKVIEIAENNGVHIYKILTLKTFESYTDKNIRGLTKLGPFKLLKSRKLDIKNSINIINKRIFDLLFSLSFIILIFWWVYIIVSLFIKFQSKGPIIFIQERVGLDGERFMCYKFRTMHITESNSIKLTKIGDSRIFKFGEFMRKTNIDEFPQFINVFIGNMSLVGPRPHMVSEDKVLANKIKKYRLRRWVKPGITGYAAIKGCRGGTENMDLMQKRINLDVRYIEKWSIFLDIKICYKTALETIFLNSKGH